MATVSAMASAAKVAHPLRVNDCVAREVMRMNNMGRSANSSPLHLCDLTSIEEQKYIQSHLCCNSGERQNVRKVYIESS
jgi:hypothetical protein